MSRRRRMRRRSAARRRQRMMRRVAVAGAMLLGLSGLHVATVAADEHTSDEPRVSFPKRFYLGLGAGQSTLEPRSPDDDLTVGDDNDTGGHLFLGLDLSRWVSAELYAADLGMPRIDFLGEEVGGIDYQVYGASLIGYAYNSRSGFAIGNRERGLFRREGLSLFGRVGVGGMRNDSDLDYERDHTAHLVVGGGLEYGFSNGFALRGEMTGFDTDARYASISILQRFGSVPVAPVSLPPTTALEPEPVATPTPLPSTPAPALFAFDRSDLDTNARDRLDAFADSLETGDVRIDLGGHADEIGSEEYNMGLSMRRANAVRSYLIGRGVDPGAIEVEAFGETRPVAPNDTPEGRALNRRVEITLSR